MKINQQNLYVDIGTCQDSYEILHCYLQSKKIICFKLFLHII